jgi:hypothetical protein
LSNATLHFEKSRLGVKFVMSFLGDRTTKALAHF